MRSRDGQNRKHNGIQLPEARAPQKHDLRAGITSVQKLGPMACGPQMHRKHVFIKSFIENSKRRVTLIFVARGTTSWKRFEVVVSRSVAQRLRCYGDRKGHHDKKHQTKSCYSRCHGARHLKLLTKNSPRFDPLVALIAIVHLKTHVFYRFCHC